MKLRNVYLAIAAGLMLALPNIAMAQSGPSSECKRTVSATGTASLTMNGAKENAVKAWTRSVVLQYGELYARWDSASEKNNEICGKSTLGLSRCEAKGRPCAPAASQGSSDSGEPGLDCNDNDSRKCQRLVKWVQRRLNDKGDAGLTVDGSEGEKTAEAIRRYKRKNGLPNPEEGVITEELIKSLRG